VINITRGLDQAKTLVGKLNKHENDRAVKKFLLERSEKKKTQSKSKSYEDNNFEKKKHRMT